MSFELIKTEEIGGVFLLTLNRPEKRNAINTQLWKELVRAFEYFENTNKLRVAVLANEGPVFCSGADLIEISQGTNHPPKGRENWGFAGITKHFFEKPIIAAVNGMALGGGTEIIVACDLVVASEGSVFGLPEPRRGLTAAEGGTLMKLAQQIPLKLACQLTFTGEPITAYEAYRWGLINKVVPEGQVIEAAMEYARQICLGSPVSIKYSKKTMYETINGDFIYPSDGWDIVEKYEHITRSSKDALEGSTAFAEKRKPLWSTSDEQ